MAITNQDKVSVGETWGSITTTWASETRTWLEISQLIGNASKVNSVVTNQAMSQTDYLWSNRMFPWSLAFPWQYISSAGLTNVSKPI